MTLGARPSGDAFIQARTASEFPQVCVHHLVEAQARRTPDAVAVDCGAETITYDDLNQRANRVARRLRNLGVARDTLVGLCAERSVDMLVGLLGILKSGGAYVPLDPAYPAERLNFMVADSGMRVLATQRAVQSALQIPSGVSTLWLDDPDVEACESTDLAADDAGATPSSIAYVIYTSGSTGRPKGVLVPHRALVNLLTSVQRRPGLSADDVVLAITTLSFDIAVSEILLPLTVGARIVLATREVATDGGALLGLIRDARVTFVDATPSTWRLLIDAGWNGGEALTAICTGEAMPRDLARALVERAGRVWNGYGPTETTVWSTFCEVTAPVDRVLIGTPIANTWIYVLDERMDPVAPGDPGELYIAGAGVACGYLNRPELTRDRFVPDPFGEPGATMYRTGDLGRYVSGGQLECLGRNDDQVKIRGFRIELGEIEEALAKHDAIARAAVIAREDHPGDRRLVGYLVLRGQRAITDAALRAYLATFLPHYMIPVAFVRLDALPLTPSGKVNRRDLPAPAPRDANDPLRLARTSTEAMLVLLWQEALGLDRVGIDDDFFALGGDSVLASQVLARLRRDHGVELLFRVLFEAPTIAQLAERIDALPRNPNQADRVIPRRAGEGPSRLSLAQERIWLLETMDPQQRIVHNLPCAWRLTGRLDEGALGRSLNAVVERHDTLRTLITVRSGVPFQEVAPVAALELGHLDLLDWPQAHREAAMLAFCDRDTRTPHDLSVPPLLRATLIRLGELEHVLYIVPHNLIWDGWSSDIFLHDLGAFYDGFTAGQPPQLQPLPIVYQDFAAWQSNWLSGDQSAPQRAWWRTRLAGDLPVLEIPSDRPRPVEPTRSATHIQARLSREQVAALSALSVHAGGTLFTILFAAFCVLAHRLSGKNDLLVGTPVHGRTRPETEKLIGLFVNMLVLRSGIEPDATFLEVLGRMRDLTLDAFGHQDLPLEALDVRAPILRAFFTMEDGRQRRQHMGDLSLKPITMMPAALAADVRLSATETPDGVSLVWSCSSELFDSDTAERIADRFQTLIRDVTRHPHRRIGDLDVIPERERALLRTFNAPLSSGRSAVCVHTLFEQQAHRTPGAAALISGADVIDYRQLDRRTTAVARALTRAGIRQGSRVAVCLTRSADLVISLLGVLKAGAICVPIDPDDPPVRRAAILADSRCELVLSNETVRGSMPQGAVPAASLAKILEGADEGPAGRADGSSPSGGLIDATACLIYTCHARRLRAAAVSHRTLAALVGAVVHALPLTAEDVALAISPPSLDIFFIELLAPLTAGARVVIVLDDVAVDAERVAEIAVASTATFVIAPTTLWAEFSANSPKPWTRLKGICVGAPPDRGQTTELMAKTAGLWTAHGFPEAGIWTTLCPLADAQRPGLVGRPLDHVRVRILDPRYGEVPIGLSGDLFIGLEASAATGSTLTTATEQVPIGSIPGIEGSWYRSGERARWHPDGSLELMAASPEQIHVGGFRVDLRDLAQVLLQELPVKDAAVVMRAQGAHHGRLVAYVTPRDGVACTATELRRELRRVLPEWVLPRSFVELNPIPREASGELSLLTRGTTDALPTDDFVPPQTATELLIAQSWKEALGLARVGAHDNFFELGGYSLLCFQVLDRIERKTGQRLSPRLLLLDTLRQVASQLDDLTAAGRTAQPPLPSIEGSFFRRFSR